MSLSCRSRAGKFPRKGQMENLGRGFVDLTVSVLTTSFCTIAWKKPQTTRKQINMASSQWHLIGNGPDLTCGLVCQLRLQHNNKNQRLLTTNHRSGPALHVRSILAHLKLILWIRNIMMSTLQARGGVWHGMLKWLAQGHAAANGKVVFDLSSSKASQSSSLYHALSSCPGCYLYTWPHVHAWILFVQPQKF